MIPTTGLCYISAQSDSLEHQQRDDSDDQTYTGDSHSNVGDIGKHLVGHGVTHTVLGPPADILQQRSNDQIQNVYFIA